MKLNGKKDVRRVNKSGASPKIFSIFQIFKSKIPLGFAKVKPSKHKIVKKALKPSRETAKKSPRTEKFRVSTYKTEAYKREKAFRGILVFIAMVSILLTGITVFYFQQVSHKLVSKKEAVVSLYEKYRSIQHLNYKTKVLLETMESHKNVPGELYVIIDKEQSLEKEEGRAIEKYRSAHKSHQPIFLNSEFPVTFSLLLASGVLLLCLIMRFFLLIKERKRILLYEVQS